MYSTPPPSPSQPWTNRPSIWAGISLSCGLVILSGWILSTMLPILAFSIGPALLAGLLALLTWHRARAVTHWLETAGFWGVLALAMLTLSMMPIVTNRLLYGVG